MTAYIWKNNQVIAYEPALNTLGAQEARDKGFLDMPTLDDNFKIVIRNRTGYFYRSIHSDIAWQHVPMEELCPEFRMALMLLGIE